MKPARKKRLMLVTLMVGGVAVAAVLALNAFNKNILFFFSPTQIASGEAPIGNAFRVGGMVVDGSVKRSEEDLEVKFDLTDTANTVTVSYTGILPDLFREGQGIVAVGKLQQGGLFEADTVLAKHDENYMPPEIADAMRKAGKLGGNGSNANQNGSYDTNDAPVNHGQDSIVSP